MRLFLLSTLYVVFLLCPVNASTSVSKLKKQNTTPPYSFYNIISNLVLVPNPAKNEVKLNFSVKNTTLNFKITDALGRIIKKIDNIRSGYILNTTNFLDGVYFVSAYNNTNKIEITKKLIIQH